MAYMAAVEAFQPTLPRGERRQYPARHSRHTISTHAPREGSDGRCSPASPSRGYFNPRSPRGERPHRPPPPNIAKIFQPTLPARGATSSAAMRAKSIRISTHAPREGSDLCAPNRCASFPGTFQPTLPARGATSAYTTCFLRHRHFNPRSPRGERLECWVFLPPCRNFNPRSPRGERPAPIAGGVRHAYFTPRSREGSDDHFARLRRSAAFQPTLPARGATQRFPP